MSHHHAGHAHAHDERPRTRKEERNRLALTLIVTVTVLCAELLGGIFAHSLALLSDAGHMLTDVVAQGLALIALAVAVRPADARRTYGWHRIEILAALSNGLILFVLSGAILWEGYRRLGQPVAVHAALMLAIAAVSVVANTIGVWLLHGLSSLNSKGAYLHLLMDTLSAGAVLVAGVIMYLAHGLYWLDPALSMVIGLFVLYSAYALIRESVDVLLEAVPRGIDLAGVTHSIDHIEGVKAVHDLHIWTITSGLYALSAHIVVEPGHTAEHDLLLNRVKEMLLADFKISHTTLQFESKEYEHVGHVC